MNINKLKSDAKQSISNTKPSPILAYVMIGAISGIASTLMDSENSFIFKIVAIVIELLLIFLSVGYMWYTLEVSRNQMPSLSSIFSSFEHALKVLILTLLITVKILLWSLLLIVPGVIKSYSYSMSFYLLHDHPEWTPSQCIEESQRIMNGNKGNLFELQLSFLGWIFLGALVSMILGVILYFALPSVVVSVVINLILAPLYTYIYVSTANFYNEVSQRTMYNM